LPGGTIRRTVDAAGNAIGQGIQGIANATGSWFTRAGDSIRTGDYRGAGRQVGQVTGELAMTFVPGLGVVGKLGLAGRLASAGGRVTSLAGTGASLVGNAARVIPVLGRGSAGMAKALSASKSAVGAARSKVDTFVGKAGSCLHSFSPATLVLTAAGAVAIGSLAVGDHVLAYDEATGTTASYPISVVHINADPETGTVVVGGETIETTPEHPFYTLEAGWLDAADLEPGMHVPSASGEPGEVSSVDFAAQPAIMYNLTVEIAHTFFVGEGEWLVHNTGCPLPGKRGLPKPGEDLYVGSYSSSARGNVRTGRNRTHTPHHAPQDAVSGVGRGRGITINIHKDLHARTSTYKRPVRPLANRREHLAADVWELRGLLRGAGYAPATRNVALLQLVRQNKRLWASTL
jgi:hypothetical protein